MLNDLKDQFFLTKREKRSFLIVTLLALFTILISENLSMFIKQDKSQDKMLAQIALFESINQVKESKPIGLNKNVLRLFNPNTASLGFFDSLGIDKKVLKNLEKYRSKGGVFKSSFDFKKLYGLDSLMFQQLNEFIHIETFDKELPFDVSNHQYAKKYPENSKYSDVITRPKESISINNASAESLKGFGFNPYAISNIVKFRAKGGFFLNQADLLFTYGIDSNLIEEFGSMIIYRLPTNFKVIDLNTAVVGDFTRIPGIAEKRASWIVKYREKLGGFNNLEQLNEVYSMDEFDLEKIKPMVELRINETKLLHPDSSTFKQFLLHPYFEYYEVKQLFDMYKQGKPINKESILANKIFDPERVEKFIKYINQNE